MPLSWPTLFRGLVMLLLALHVFYMYSIARGMSDGAGVNLPGMIVAAAFSLVMLLPLIWAVTLPELPDIFTSHIRARRWWRAGRCPGCGYERRGLPENASCPECGSPSAEPRSYRVSARTIRLFIIVNALAWMVGMGAGEAWLRTDEAAFRREVEAARLRGSPWYARPPRWPHHGLLYWREREGFTRTRGGLADRPAPPPP
jgi:hypothetical protein